MEVHDKSCSCVIYAGELMVLLLIFNYFCRSREPREQHQDTARRGRGEEGLLRGQAAGVQLRPVLRLRRAHAHLHTERIAHEPRAPRPRPARTRQLAPAELNTGTGCSDNDSGPYHLKKRFDQI